MLDLPLAAQEEAAPITDDLIPDASETTDDAPEAIAPEIPSPAVVVADAVGKEAEVTIAS